MAIGETAKLLASLSLKDDFTPTMQRADRSLGRFDAHLGRTSGRAYRAGQQIGTGIKNVGKLAAVGFGVLATNVAIGVDKLIDLEKATAQTEAVIKSTGGAAGVTADQVRALSEKFEGLNAQVGDEFIQSAQNMILTFTNIRGKAFEPALQAVLDMNTAMGKGPEGLTQTAIQVGKALNNPVKGLTALQRVGVTFDAAQTKRIKKLVKEGKLYDAQRVILAELGKEFGGSFARQGDTAAGSIAKFSDAIEDIQKELATAALPAVRNFADAMTELLADPEIQQGVKDLGVEIGKVLSKENIKKAVGVIGDVFRAIKDAAPAVKSALQGAGEVLSKAFDAFNALPEPVKQLLVGGAVVNKLTGGLVTNAIGGIFGALKSMVVRANIVQVSGTISGAGGAGGAAGAVAGGKGGGLAGALTKGLSIASIVGSVASVIATQQQVSGSNSDIAAGIKSGLDASIAGKTLPELKTALAAVDTGIDKIQSNPLNVLVQGSALDSLRGMRSSLVSQIAKTETGFRDLSMDGDRQARALQGAKLAIDGAKRATEIGTSATKSEGAATRHALRSLPAPHVNVQVKVGVAATNVVKKYTTIRRMGPVGGSRSGRGASGPLERD